MGFAVADAIATVRVVVALGALAEVNAKAVVIEGPSRKLAQVWVG